MTKLAGGTELGVNEVAKRIHGRLQRYLEATYHIRDADLVEERRQLLQEPGQISQRPFVEITPSYDVAGGFEHVKAPAVVTGLLSELASWSIGVFPPYRHQSEALEAFFSRAQGDNGDDLIVATGTGSGKTETFLYTVLGALAREGQERPDSFRRDGVRALLLYPMNALVSDQTARLRRLVGNPQLAALFRERWGRHPRFGMYTSRTPYPGMRSDKKDERHIEPLLEYYQGLETSSDQADQRLVKELKDRGRWPAKDVQAFLASDMIERKLYQSGKKAGQEFKRRNWKERLVTQPGDRELLTRHEMQAHAPDLLVTNYSMLEYMLLRPIERSIFAQTREWLASDPRNQLILILDEAHMYRGVGGAEVGLLIRRLQARLGITRDRLRCILTSASLGAGPEAEAAGKAFASGLTGVRTSGGFQVIRGTPEPRAGASVGSPAEATALAMVNSAALAAAEGNPEAARGTLTQLVAALGWPAFPPTDHGLLPLRQYVARQLTGFGPMEALIKRCAGNATEFSELASEIFPGMQQMEAEAATDGLLGLGSFSRRWEPGRQELPLTPTRVHLLFRGLPPQYACINPTCSERRHRPGENALLGKLFTEPRTNCKCGSRVFELLTHRDCGAAYLRVFGEGSQAKFLWNERGGILTAFGRQLDELHFLLEPPHPSMRDAARVTPIWIHLATGRVEVSPPADESGYRLCYRPGSPDTSKGGQVTFKACPVCTKAARSGQGGLKIMDLATKGEQPFANLVREQFVCQAATKMADEHLPNAGRKALLFSDGRQKAARLARDLPREVERDSFREAIVAAVADLQKLGKEPRLDTYIYAAFIGVCARHHLHFFDGQAQRRLLEECHRFQDEFDGDLEVAFEMDWRPEPPPRFREALTRQICDRYYSLLAACACVVEPRKVALLQLEKKLGAGIERDTLLAVTRAWILEMLEETAFDPALARNMREEVSPYFEPLQAQAPLKAFFDSVRKRTGWSEEVVNKVRDALFQVFTREANDDSGRVLAPDTLVMRLALDDSWLQCASCGHVQAYPFLGTCASCGEKQLEDRPPDHPYMVARKGFFRAPLRAILAGEPPVHITAEEHTAQLTHRDAGVVYATTEEFELRFQDVPLGPDKPPVDVLSCTTTMEVGIDIGSLTAVGLRTVPPQRENYQQRAGRAGRRGTSISSVLTFAQGGPHDAHYFAHPHSIISGPPREPRIKSDNRRLARRHINSYLLQTFFHLQLDCLSEEEQREVAASRPHLMSAFGSAEGFFESEGDFTLAAFERWLHKAVLGQSKAVLQDIASWLPQEMLPSGEPKAGVQFIEQVARDLLAHLQELGQHFEGASANAIPQDEEEAGTLLDCLFANGLLPSYAFPTDLASFTIQDIGEKDRLQIKERPQLAKIQALSEYAPGRLLVVNKLTYRVGGIFVDGPPTTAPATALMAEVRTRYIGCKQCTYVKLESGRQASTVASDSTCPVCGSELIISELLDPPGFSPQEGTHRKDRDRDQEITYASTAQLPEMVDREEFTWHDGAGAHLKHAFGEDVELVVVNKGQEDLSGFAVCERCGAAWLDDQAPSSSGHRRPFKLPRHVLAREQASRDCHGTIRKGLYLGHQFKTDILLLQLGLSQPLDFSPHQPWLRDALSTFAEALALAASLYLDIDPGELSAGYRMLADTEGQGGLAEVYLFDTASGGAGYAAEAGQDLKAVLDEMERLLRECPAGCERSCTMCLRHYGNRMQHNHLDRHLALALLRHVRFGEVPPIELPGVQARQLLALGRLLELEGWTVRLADGTKAKEDPMIATRRDGVSVAIGTYPALRSEEDARRNHPVHENGGAALILPDYLVSRDLPSAHQWLIYHVPAASSATSHQAPVARPNVIELPAYEMTQLLEGQVAQPARKVKLATDAPPGSVAVRVPSDALSVAGIEADGWLVVRLQAPPSDRLQEYGRMLLINSRGAFRATQEPWTVAQAKQLAPEVGSKVQISYHRTEAVFRPERLDKDAVKILGAIHDVVSREEG